MKFHDSDGSDDNDDTDDYDHDELMKGCFQFQNQHTVRFIQ